MRELSLFSGAGGGLLGSLVLGHEIVGYVEDDEYCQRVLAQRIDDGYLPVAPIFGDIRAFLGEGYAGSYTGMVDIITAGFPCQPFSVAGKREGADDARNLWPETLECIRTVAPRFVLLENVPGLISSGYFATVLGGLAESGYDARWRVLSAGEVGAPHKRDRLWILAHAQCMRELQPQGGERDERGRAGDAGADVAHAAKQPKRKQDNKTCAESREDAWPGVGCGGWWAVEPPLGRVANGVADRVGQLKALGNGQVPAVVAAVWRELTDGL